MWWKKPPSNPNKNHCDLYSTPERKREKRGGFWIFTSSSKQLLPSPASNPIQFDDGGVKF